MNYTEIIQYLKKYENNYNNCYKTLENILKIFPQITQQDAIDERQPQYNNSLNQYRLLIQKMMSWPHTFSDLQGQTRSLLEQFQRNQNKILKRIKEIHKLSIEELGPLFIDNDKNISNLCMLKEKWNKELLKLSSDQISQQIVYILKYYSLIFGFKFNESEQTELEILYAGKQLILEKELQNHITSIYDNKKNFLYELAELENQNKIQKQNIQQLSKDEILLEKQIDQINEDINNKYEDIKKNKANDLLKVRQSIHEIVTKLNGLLNLTSDQKALLLQLREEEQLIIQDKTTLESISILYEDTVTKLKKQLKIVNFNKHESYLELEKTNILIQKLIQEFSSINLDDIREIETSFDNFNANKLVLQKIKKTKDIYQNKFNKNEEKLDDIKQAKRKTIFQKEEEINVLGFQNESHFLQFYDQFQQAEKVEDCYKTILKQYIYLIECTVDIGKMLEYSINFSELCTRNIDFYYFEKRIFEHYVKQDQSINISNKYEAKKKMIQLIDSSILENCNLCENETFQFKVIRNIELTDFFKIIDYERQKQERFIQQNIIPNIIIEPKDLFELKQYLRKEQKKKAFAEEKYDKLKILQTQEKNDVEDERIQNKISALEDSIDSIDDKIDRINEDYETIKSEYLDANQEKVKIVNQICFAFLQAITDEAKRQQKNNQTLRNYIEQAEDSCDCLRDYSPI